MSEQVFSAAVGQYKSIPFGIVKPLNFAYSHELSLPKDHLCFFDFGQKIASSQVAVKYS